MKAKEWHSRTLKVYLSYTLLKKEIHKYFRREEKKTERERRDRHGYQENGMDAWNFYFG